MDMSTYESLSHSKWDCKYHIVFVPKGRKKELYGKVRKFLGPVFHELAAQRRSEILEGHMVQDHVHMLIRIPPKYSVAEVVGYLKGKSAIAVARQFGGRKRNFNGETLWARGYAVSTVGFEEEQIRRYIRNQEQLDTPHSIGFSGGRLSSYVEGSSALDFPIGGFSPPEGRLARGFKPPAFSRFLFQSAVKSAESF
jgi:putative transposase